MSTRIDASGDSVRRTTALPSDTLLTIMMLVYTVNDRAGNYRYLTGIENATTNASAYKVLGWSSSNAFEISSESGSGSFSAAPSTGKWFWVALTCGSTGANSLNGYWRYLLPSDGATVYTASATSTAFTEAMLVFGNDSYSEWCDVRISVRKVWDAVLTQAEIENEMEQMEPVRWDSLHMFIPSFDNAGDRLNDYSGNVKTLTATGTLTDEADPPIPWSLEQDYFVYVPTSTPSGAMTGVSLGLSTGYAGLLGSGVLSGRDTGVSGNRGSLTGSGALLGNDSGCGVEYGTLAGVAALMVRTASGSFAYAGLLGTGSLAGNDLGTSYEYVLLVGVGSLGGQVGSEAFAYGTLADYVLGNGVLVGRVAGYSMSYSSLLGSGALGAKTESYSSEIGALSGYGALVGADFGASYEYLNLGTLPAGAMTGVSAGISLVYAVLLGAGVIYGYDVSQSFGRGTLSGVTAVTAIVRSWTLYPRTTALTLDERTTALTVHPRTTSLTLEEDDR